MARYRCENCNELRDAAICPKCGADTHRLDEQARDDRSTPSLDDLASRVSQRAAATEAPKPAPAPLPAAPPPAPAAQPHSQAVPPSTIIGLDEFHALLDRGTEAVIICGAAQTGKSEIAAGYIRANTVYRGKAQNLTLRAVLRTDYALGGTAPDEVWYQIIDDKKAFLDPSGEFFRRLSPDERIRYGLPDVTEENFQFVQRAVSRLAGIVVVVDLTSAIDPRASAPWRRQEDDLKFVLSALRWLRWDHTARPDAIGLSTNIAQRVSMFPRIDKRVLVLFSKADQLPKYTNQTPLDFARQRLPVLHAALMTHAKRFRYDFCNTMIKTESGDQAVDPCGVLLPVNWLLDDSFDWLPLQLPTSLIGGGQ
ncbi:MAG TPA: zinc ribbon domain-containing protein [Thermoanaerobaculia bacterium]|nr:zinc ribbon domain-containing protein [Thermoanaerobaculia bacterium]